MNKVFPLLLCCAALFFGRGLSAQTPCEISNLTVEILPCNNAGQFFVELNFEFQGVSADGFKVQGNGTHYGDFQYDDLPITLGPLPGDGTTPYEFVVTDLGFGDCSAALELGAMNCFPQNCEIFDLIAEPHPCTPNGVFFVDIAFQVENPGSEGFTVSANGTALGDFEYGELFYTVGPLVGDGVTSYVLEIQDKTEPDCSAALTLDPIDCNLGPCPLLDPFLEPGDCHDDGTFDLTLDFEVFNPTDDTAYVLFEGDTLTLFTLAQLPITLSHFDDRNQAHPLLEICIPVWDCCREVSFDSPQCPRIESACFDFAGLDDSTSYHIPDYAIGDVLFEEHGIPAVIEAVQPAGFFYSIFVGNDSLQGLNFEFNRAEGSYLIFLLANLSFDFAAFDYPVTQVSFDYQLGIPGLGSVFFNLGANGHDYLIGSTPPDAPVEIAPGVWALFEPDPDHDDEGRVTITGPIEQLVLGGGEFAVDNLCFEYAIPDCHFQHLIAEAHACDDDGNFLIDLAFEVQGPSADGFAVFVNGDEVAVFQYGEPFYTIGPFPGDGSTVYEIVVQDLGQNACNAHTALGPIDCSAVCQITDLAVEAGNCHDDGSFDVWVNFNVQNPNGNSFQVFIGSAVYGPFHLDDLPVKIEGVHAPGAVVQELKVCMNTPALSCCAETEFEVPICPPPTCTISDILVEPHSCTPNGVFFVDIAFHALGGSDDGFSVFGANGQFYGSFHYGEPFYTIGPFEGDGTTVYGLIIQDNANPDCAADFTVGPIDCQGNCHITDLVADPGDCNDDGTFNLWVNFNVENPGSDLFVVFVSNQTFGPFHLDDLPVKLEHVPPTGAVVQGLGVCVGNQMGCCAETEFEVPHCPPPACEIFDLIAEPHPCTANGTFLVDIAFMAHGVGNDGFTIRGNGQVYGVFDYGEPFYTIGPLEGDGTTVYEFVIQDNQHPDCKAFTTLGPIDCSGTCHISDLVVEVGDCNDDGTYNLWLDFHVQNPGNDFFEVFYEGHLLGFFPLDELPLKLEHFQDNGEPIQELVVCINDHPNCCAAVEFEAPDCGPGDCLISDLSATPLDCNDDGTYNLKIDFEVSSPGNDFFEVFYEGQLIGIWLISDLPVVIEHFEDNGEPAQKIEVCINDQPHCCASAEFEAPDCNPCNIRDVLVSFTDCSDNGTFGIELDFLHSHTGNDGFSVAANGELFGPFGYDELPIVFGEFDGTGIPQLIELKIFDNQIDDCFWTGVVVPPNCNGPNCPEMVITGVEATCSNTLDGGYNLWVNAEFGAGISDTVIVYGPHGNVFSGRDPSSFPAQFNNVPPDEIAVHLPDGLAGVITICDASNECCVTEVFPLPDCQPCEIFNLSTHLLECENGLFFVELNFDFHNVGSDGFTVKGNGNNYGTFGYDELPIVLGPLEADGTTIYEFIVFDNQHPDCSADTFMEPIFCPPADCAIHDLKVEPLECNGDGTYQLWLDFDYENATHDFFDVFVLGQHVGFFPLDELPVVVPHFPATGFPHDIVTVCINDNPDCCATLEFDAPDCHGILTWPGDVSYFDNTVTLHDLLFLGIAFGETGPGRVVQGIEWTGLEGAYWRKFFANGADYKHADCNGDGEVNLKDVEAIVANFGKSHGNAIPVDNTIGSETDPALFVQLPMAEEIANGESFAFPVVLGSEALPVMDLYGLAFTIEFDPEIIDPESVDVTFEKSWLGTQGVNLIALDKTDLEEGKVYVALTRNDHNNASGFGEIASFIGIIDNIAGKEEMVIQITDVRAIQADEVEVPLFNPESRVQLITGTRNPNANNRITLFPNPTSGMVYIRNTLNLPVEIIDLRTVEGRQLAVFHPKANFIDLSDLAPGVYLLKIKIGGRFFHERVVLMD
ncbi:MAG: T9SS C-terminal target domain-containing protein [Bacteroidetes bacterium]|nr:MAG: T9SS C-terminal target domain-containing protein [Bacteroidota bacterium]